MKDKEGVDWIVFLIIILAVASILMLNSGIKLSPEGVSYHSNNLQQIYSAGEKIRGSVNLSFDSIDSSVVISSNFIGNISLLNLLLNSSLEMGEDFECSTSNCLPDYSSGNAINRVNINGEKVVGFSITGEVSSVNSVSLIINSNAQASCVGQLFIDVLDDKKNVLVSNSTSGQTCEPLFKGCFDSEYSNSDVIITSSNEYCQNMTMPAAPAYHIGGRILNSTQGEGTLKMRLYNQEIDLLGECVLPKHTTNDYQFRRCTVGYSSPIQQSYFVCITAGTDNRDANYKIKFENSNQGELCGTNNFQGMNVDYELSARTLQFGAVDNLKIENVFEDSTGISLSSRVDEYIIERYGGNCNPSCSIPIRFFGAQQTINFLNPKIIYTAGQGSVESNSMYELNKVNSKISSNQISIDLGKAGFEIPLGSASDKFILYLNGEKIFERNITVRESFAFDVTPRFVSFGQEATFVANVSGNISSSIWNFGDNSSSVSVNGRSAKHRYLSQGEFDLRTTLIRSDGVNSTRTFTITVGDPKSFANLTIADYKKRLNNLSAIINSQESWIQNGLREKIDVQVLNNSLKTIESDFNSASTSEEFEDVVLDLINLKVPKEIKLNRGLELPLLVGFENVDVSYIESISGETVDDESSLKKAISGWMSQNLNSKILSEEFVAVYDQGEEVILTKFKIQTLPKSTIDGAYLVIGTDVESEGGFKSDYGQKSISAEGYSYIVLGEKNEVFEFYLEGEYLSEDLGAYISPTISRLGSFEEQEISECNFDKICDGNEDRTCSDCRGFRFGLFVTWMVILLILAVIVYIVLQEWYKRRYEGHLFKNRDDLYNLINFIYNSRRAGLGDREIRDKLSKSGWKGEQVSYAFRKIEGKRTGMYEIPIFKFIENRKVKQEIAKRQQSAVDTRFIKRPNL